jgi:hypothetical protein
MRDTGNTALSRPRFDLLLPSTQRALHRRGIFNDADVAKLTNRDLHLLAYIGPQGRADIRRLFPNPAGAVAIPSANGDLPTTYDRGGGPVAE